MLRVKKTHCMIQRACNDSHYSRR